MITFDGPGRPDDEEDVPAWAWALLTVLFIVVAVVCASAQGVNT